MTKKTEKTETQTEGKNRLVGKLTYLPHRSNGYGTAIGPVFSTSREDCKSVVVESIPLDLIRDLQRGEVGAFFIWDRKEESGA
jgi:hypothetical protein